jgi:hypothetical protein
MNKDKRQTEEQAKPFGKLFSGLWKFEQGQASEPIRLYLPTFRLTADSLPRLLSISY